MTKMAIKIYYNVFVLNAFVFIECLLVIQSSFRHHSLHMGHFGVFVY